MGAWYDELETRVKQVERNKSENQLIIEALIFLDSVDDGATSRDGEGFNQRDTEFGHSLAIQAQERGLSRKQIFAAKEMLYKYRKQLWNQGISLFDPLVQEVPHG